MSKVSEVYREKGLSGLARWVVLKRIGKPLFRSLDDFLARESLVGDPDVFDRRDFEFVPTLEADWKAVRRELDALMADPDLIPPVRSLQPDQEKTAIDDGWRSFMLYGYGLRSDYGCERCPETARLLESIPGRVSGFFSVLVPGTHIPKHSGVTKALVRCHLALVVPESGEQCRMQVGDETVYWEEGRCVVFDDSAKHEVWNDTNESRVVLIVDVERPMRWRGRQLGRALLLTLQLSPFLQSARRNLRAWEREMRDRTASEGSRAGA